MVLPVLAATVINSALMFIYYRAELFPGSSGVMENFGIIFAGKKTPEMLAQENAFYAHRAAYEEAPDQGQDDNAGWTLWSKIQVFIVTLFLIFFALGYDVCVASICASGLLMLFIGQFLLIGSFDDTGIPQAFFSITMGGCADQMTSVPCVYWFVMVITILSNIASNVP